MLFLVLHVHIRGDRMTSIDLCIGTTMSGLAAHTSAGAPSGRLNGLSALCGKYALSEGFWNRFRGSCGEPEDIDDFFRCRVKYPTVRRSR